MNKLVWKKVSSFLILILVILISTKFSSAMGFGQNEQAQLTYKPNLETSYSYTIIPTSPHTLDYSIGLRGDLAQYISVTPTILKEISPNQNPSIIASIKLPSELPAEILPGGHTVFIHVEENLSSITADGIGAKSAVDILIRILVLYPTKYLGSTLNIANINENEDITAEITIANYGEEIINAVKGIIEIYDSNNTLVKTLNTNTKMFLESNSNSKLIAKGNSIGLKPGDYSAKAFINWDENNSVSETKFRIGSLDIAINSFTKEMELDTINEVSINIESLWNDLLKDVYAIISVDEESIKTPTVDLEPWQKQFLKGYLNTEGLTLGEHPITITVFYGEEEITTKTGTINIIEQKGKLIQEAPAPVKNELAGIQIMMYILSAMVFVLIAFNVFLMMKNKKKD